MSEYFLITTDEEGATQVEPLTREQLKDRITGWDFHFVADLGDECRARYWDGNALIIKGEVVVPQPKKVVTEWDV